MCLVRLRASLVLLAVFLWADRTAEGKEVVSEECPSGYYRSGAIVFGCHGSTGIARYLLAPAATTPVVNIPAGVKNFTLEATADTGMDLRLADPADGTYIFNNNDRRSGFFTRRTPSGIYKGVNATFSEDAGAVPATERLELLGTMPGPTVLSFSNSDSSWGTVVLNFSYNGLEACPDAPEGCSGYDEAAAREELLSWSRWVQSAYTSADEAWLRRGAPHARSSTGGVLWHRWPLVWTQSMGTPAGLSSKAWQPAFHYLDSDSNGEVSQTEFQAGYSATPARSGLTTTGTAVPALPDSLTPKAPPHARRESWTTRHRTRICLGSIAMLALLLLAWLCLVKCPRPDLKTRGARTVRSRDADVDQLEPGDGSASEQRDRNFNGGRCMTWSEGHSPSGAQEPGPPLEPGQPSGFPGLSPAPLLGFLAASPVPVLRSGWPPFPSGFWPCQTPVRYSPVSTSADELELSPRLRPAQVVPHRGHCRQAAPGRPLLRPAGSFHGSRSMASVREPTSVPTAADRSSPPLRAVQAAPKHLQRKELKPEVRIVERQQSFRGTLNRVRPFSRSPSPSHSGASRALGLPGSAKTAKAQSFSHVPDHKAAPGLPSRPSSPLASKARSFSGIPSPEGMPGAPGLLLASQGTWAAVFTPEEWSRTTQSAHDPDSPHNSHVLVDRSLLARGDSPGRDRAAPW